MIHDEIMRALEGLGVPVDFHTYSGKARTYITYSQYDEEASLNANDQEIATNYFYQINVISKGNYKRLVRDVKQKMNEINGTRLTEQELYLKEYYQRSIRFKFTRFI